MHRLGIMPRRLLCEAVSSPPGETGLGSQKSIENTPGASGKTMAERKRTCKSVEQEENHDTKKARAGRGHETRWEISIVCGLSIKDNRTL